MLKKYLMGVSLLAIVGVLGCPGVMRTPDGNDNTGMNDNANDNEGDNVNDNAGGSTERDLIEYVLELIDNTSDDAEPVIIDDVNFTFDEESEPIEVMIEESP